MTEWLQELKKRLDEVNHDSISSLKDTIRAIDKIVALASNGVKPPSSYNDKKPTICSYGKMTFTIGIEQLADTPFPCDVVYGKKKHHCRDFGAFKHAMMAIKNEIDKELSNKK